MHDLVVEAARKHPEDPAVSQGSTCISYGALLGASQSIRSLLVSRGVGPGDAVPILSSRCPEMVACVLAILAVGAHWVPMELETWGSDRVNSVLAAVEHRVVVTTGTTTHEIPNAILPRDIAAAFRDGLGNARAPSQLETMYSDAPAHDDDYAYIIFTSGTTGNPKGVIASHLNLLRYVLDDGGVTDGPYNLGTRRGDRILLVFSVAFDGVSLIEFLAIDSGFVANKPSFPSLLRGSLQRFMPRRRSCSLWAVDAN